MTEDQLRRVSLALSHAALLVGQLKTQMRLSPEDRRACQTIQFELQQCEDILYNCLLDKGESGAKDREATTQQSTDQSVQVGPINSFNGEGGAGRQEVPQAGE